MVRVGIRGRFVHTLAPQEVFDFAFEVKRQLGVPWVSCDVVVYEDRPALIEFQIVHYGTITLDLAKQHLIRQDDQSYRTVEGPVPIETAMVEEIHQVMTAGQTHGQTY